MDAFKILCALSVVFCAAIIEAAPIKRYDQRQDGDLNIQAHLDKIVLLIIPSKNINILDIKGQGQFDNYEDILPLFGGKAESSLNEFKFKSAADLDKEKKTAITEIKDEKKDIFDSTKQQKPVIPDKPEPKETKVEPKKPSSSVEIAPKKVENDTRSGPESQKRLTPKSDSGRTYQTVHSANNRERVIAISNQDEVKKEEVPHNATKIEKL
ncbi:uncharacterized protein LOC135836513 [Planococcus citri]|uniref:uncharacterized protein LOC135836513 n=1 Tax=Planococcus citri TaxID=170843 RepID=UPI0031F86CA4